MKAVGVAVTPFCFITESKLGIPKIQELLRLSARKLDKPTYRRTSQVMNFHSLKNTSVHSCKLAISRRIYDSTSYAPWRSYGISGIVECCEMSSYIQMRMLTWTKRRERRYSLGDECDEIAACEQPQWGSALVYRRSQVLVSQPCNLSSCH